MDSNTRNLPLDVVDLIVEQLNDLLNKSYIARGTKFLVFGNLSLAGWDWYYATRKIIWEKTDVESLAKLQFLKTLWGNEGGLIPNLIHLRFNAIQYTPSTQSMNNFSSTLPLLTLFSCSINSTNMELIYKIIAHAPTLQTLTLRIADSDSDFISSPILTSASLLTLQIHLQFPTTLFIDSVPLLPITALATLSTFSLTIGIMNDMINLDYGDINNFILLSSATLKKLSIDKESGIFSLRGPIYNYNELASTFSKLLVLESLEIELYNLPDNILRKLPPSLSTLHGISLTEEQLEDLSKKPVIVSKLKEISLKDPGAIVLGLVPISVEILRLEYPDELEDFVSAFMGVSSSETVKHSIRQIDVPGSYDEELDQYIDVFGESHSLINLYNEMGIIVNHDDPY